MDPKKILIIQQKMIGDVLTTSILFEALKTKFPTSELHYLVNQNCVPVVENNPFIDELITISVKTEKNVHMLWKLGSFLKSKKYDIVIDVYSKNSSAFLTFKTNAKIRIGLKKWYLKWAYTNSIETSDISVEIPKAFYNRLEFLKPLNVPIDLNLAPKIFISEDEKLQMQELLKKEDFSENDELVMVNCLGSEASKTYPLKYMAKFLDTFISFYPNKKLLLNYIPMQLKEVEELIHLCDPKTKSVILKFYAPSLRKFIVLTSFCEAVIGNEGGAINIGKALDLKTFAIFSPWVSAEAWGHQNSEKYLNVHLREFRPELFEGKSKKEIKRNVAAFYEAFKPELFADRLKKFL
ncbi:MAG TPA: glycosyltransferase family 9 protein [Salinimicrobium sp.]|nr:glycosyltransferase family 9 protein [Salinimicrobium sp.]